MIRYADRGSDLFQLGVRIANEALDEWAISRNWWKIHVIILNLLYLKGFGNLHFSGELSS